MRLEDELKQSKFPDEQQKALLNISYTANQLGILEVRFFKKFDLSPQQYNVLRILRGQFPKPATVNLLVDRMLDKSSNASRLVDKLKAKGLLERVQCPDDRRAVNIVITTKGQDLLQTIEKEHRFQPNGILKNMSDDELSQLNILLDKVRGNLDC